MSRRTGNILFWVAIIVLNLLVFSQGGYNRGYDYYEPQIEEHWEP